MILLVALTVSMALIPAMIRLAPHIGMIDKPDARKVHVAPIPRAGGVGIVIGALLPVLIWLPLNDMLIAYLVGSMVLLMFGVWDDIAELGHYVKFVGQFFAAVFVVYYGDVVVATLPFMNLDPLPSSIGKPFTVIALVGVINAMNHSDGLDGLAGGESLMTLAGILYLASQASSMETVVISVAVMGGVFGFLRFNSHPARVFMGDGGSQFLGFSLGVLVVQLSQRDNPALSPMVPLLLLGLPIADILVVFWKRARAGGNWFKATKNHIHHRLLELGFHHYESVAVIYTLQAILVVAAVSAPYAADGALLTFYLSMCIALFLGLRRAEASGWRARSGVTQPGRVIGTLASWNHNHVTAYASGLVVSVAVSLYMLVEAFAIAEIPPDLAVIAGVLAAALVIRLALGYRVWFLMLRLLMFMAIALVVFLAVRYPRDLISGFEWVNYAFFGILALAIIVGVRAAERERFRVSPLDYLVVLITLGLALVPETSLQTSGLVEMALHAILLFYGAELALRQMNHRWNAFTVSIMLSLVVVTARGLLK